MEAYKIGVTIALTNLVGTELTNLIGQFGRADKAALGLAGSMKLLGGIVAVGIVSAFAAGVEEAKKFQTEVAKFQTLGFGDKVNGDAQSFAEHMRTAGTSARENMALVTDAMAVFKNLDHAEMAAPIMAQMKFANAALYGDQGGARDQKFMDMLKVIEFRGGLSSDAEFQTQANFVQQVINGSRNRVDGTALLQALKTGGVALSRRENSAFYLGSEPLIQEFGGQRYGTGAMSAYQNLVMLRTTQRALTEDMRLGLLDPHKIEMNGFTGKVKSAQPGAMKGGDILAKEGELAFLEKVLLPAFAAKGITSDDAIIQELGTILTNRTASGLFARIYQQRNQLHTQIDANRNAQNIAQTVKTADLTQAGQLIELEAQWHTLLKELGTLILPTVISVTKGLVAVLREVNGFSNWKSDAEKSIKDQGRDGLSGSLNWWSTHLGGSSSVPQAKQSAITINTTTVLDGQVIAKSVTKHQDIQMQGVASMGSTGSTADYGLTQYRPSFGY
jgi:hypothetical protein